MLLLDFQPNPTIAYRKSMEKVFLKNTFAKFKTKEKKEKDRRNCCNYFPLEPMIWMVIFCLAPDGFISCNEQNFRYICTMISVVSLLCLLFGFASEIRLECWTISHPEIHLLFSETVDSKLSHEKAENCIWIIKQLSPTRTICVRREIYIRIWSCPSSPSGEMIAGLNFWICIFL